MLAVTPWLQGRNVTMLSHLRYPVATATAIALLTSCAGGSSTPAAPLAFQNQSLTPKRANACPCLYVANLGGTEVPGSITVYPAGANGNAKPIQTIKGSKTGLNYPADVAVDANGNMYVVNSGYFGGPFSVTVYAAGATGNVKPIQTIRNGTSGSGLELPFGIALDPLNGDIYVANADGGSSGSSTVGSVAIYAPGSNGYVPPIGIIEGSSTGLQSPRGLVLDASGNVYVSNGGNNSVTVYASGSTGNVAPTQTISGSKTGLAYVWGLALDADLNLYVANVQGDKATHAGSVTIYSPGSTGNVAPASTIGGGRTKLAAPFGVAVDGSGNTYVASVNDPVAVTIYAAGKNGNIKPIDTIKGARTGLGNPHGIAIR